MNAPKPATAALQPPTVRPPTPGQCSAGITPCGQPARFYPAGWLCVDHAPGNRK